jgi:hypothetical protein
MSKTNVNEVKLGGARRKNGHKSTCTCHICENMKNKAKRGGYQEELEIEQEKIMGGSKKKNGHRRDCKCPICKNMKNAKKGGGDDEFLKEEQEEEIDFSGGKKKKGNGHKASCKCPICKNMRKSKKGGDIEEGTADNSEPLITPRSTSPYPSSAPETPASSDDYDALDSAEKGEAGQNVVGGTRKHRKRGGKKWGGKTRHTRRRNRSRRHH